MKWVTAGILIAVCASSLADKITLRLSSWEGDEALRIQRQCIANFMREHPDIDVKLETISADMYYQKLLTEYAANSAPDVSMMGFEHFQALASRDALLDLDDYTRNTPGFELSAYYKPIIDVHRYNGKLYVLPRDIAPMGLIYYNKRLFDQAHIPYPDGSWTWDFQERPELKDKDFLWVVHQLTKLAPDGSIEQWGFSPGWAGLLADSFRDCMGLKFIDNDEHPTKVLCDDPGIVKVYELEQDLMLRKKWVPTPTEISSRLQTNTTAMFAAQKLAMMEGGIWEVPNLRRQIDQTKVDRFDWDIALFPGYAHGARHFPSGGSGYAIFKTCPHPREAWELVRYLAGPESMKLLAAGGLAQPAIKALAQSEPWLVGPDTPLPNRFPPSRQIADEAVQFVTFAPTSQYFDDVNNIINSHVDSIWTGDHGVQEELAQAQKEAQVKLDSLNKEESLRPFNWAIGLVIGIAVLAGIGFWVYSPEFGKKHNARQKAENWAAYKFIFPWVFGFLTLCMGPMVLSFLMSWANWDIIRPALWRGTQNYVEAFTVDPKFWVSLKVTAIYTAFAVPLGIIGSLMLALLLNVKIKGMPLFRTCYYIPSLASTVASVLLWKKLFQPDGGLINTIIYGANGKGNFLGLATLLHPWATAGGQINWIGSEHTALAAFVIMSLWGIGGGMIILLAGLQGIPEYYYEAATLDGANSIQKFKAVTFPMLTPALFFVLVTGAIGSFQVFTQSFVMTGGGPGDATRFYMLNLYNEAFMSLRMGYASALAWILFFIILAMTFVQFRLSKWVYTEGR